VETVSILLEETKLSTAKTSSYDTVLRTVRQWPPERRFALVRDVINTLAEEVSSARPRRKTLERALGLLATDKPAPSESEIERWLDERRMEKYG
jgi:dihydroneopterin aldolase